LFYLSEITELIAKHSPPKAIYWAHL